MRQVTFGVPLRGDPPWPNAGEDQAGHDRLVAVAAEQQAAGMVPSHGEHRRLHRQGAAAGGEERLVRADRVCHEFFGVAQKAAAGASVVQTA